MLLKYFHSTMHNNLFSGLWHFPRTSLLTVAVLPLPGDFWVSLWSWSSSWIFVQLMPVSCIIHIPTNWSNPPWSFYLKIIRQACCSQPCHITIKINNIFEIYSLWYRPRSILAFLCDRGKDFPSISNFLNLFFVKGIVGWSTV